MFIQSSDLEEIDHIVNIPFRQAPWCYGPSQIRVTLEVVLASRQNGVDVRITACAEKVVDTTAILVCAVPGECIFHNGGQGPHIGEVGPQAVMSGDVRSVKLLSAGGPEAFTWVVKVPNIQIT